MILPHDIAAGLRRIGVAASDTIYVHSGLRGSLRVEGRTAADKMATVLEGLRATVPDGTLMMPTFTYSFTRGEDFDVTASPSTVGVLTESFRKEEGVRRTPEPLFSSAIEGPVDPGWEERLFTVGDVECFGPDSIFAYLYEIDAKIVFYGVEFDSCTFVHHVEQRHGVPYRFMKEFSGSVRDAEGAEHAITARYYVRELREGTTVYFDPLARALHEAGAMQSLTLPDGPELMVTSARALEAVTSGKLDEQPYFVVREGHEETP